MEPKIEPNFTLGEISRTTLLAGVSSPYWNALEKQLAQALLDLLEHAPSSPAAPDSKGLIDDLSATIVADALSGKDAAFLVNRVRARIEAYVGWMLQKRKGSSPAAPTPHMSAAEFYRRVWIKENASDPRGDWPIRMAEAYAAPETARADRAEQDISRNKPSGFKDLAEWKAQWEMLCESSVKETYKLIAAEADLQRKDAAMREMLDVKFPAICTHGGEPWYCDSCKYGWEKAIAAAMEKIAASL